VTFGVTFVRIMVTMDQYPNATEPQAPAATKDGSLIDIPELAQRLGVTPRHVRRLISERRIPFIRWSHLIRFDPEEVDAWLESARVPAMPPGRPV
jgi:excisionase family DNA binding protein